MSPLPLHEQRKVFTLIINPTAPHEARTKESWLPLKFYFFNKSPVTINSQSHPRPQSDRVNQNGIAT